MADKIFQDVETQYGGGMKINKGFVLKISGDGGAIEGLIVQNMDLAVQRPITTLYDLTSNYVYYVSGRCMTQLTLQKACGPKGIIKAFYENLGDVCKAGKNNMNFKLPSGCETGGIMGALGGAVGALTGGNNYNVIIAKNCVLTNVAFACNVQNYVVYDNCQIQGTELEMDTA